MYQYGAGTNVGNVRDNNEDSLVCDDERGLWVVADGMGGLGFGEVASAISTYTVTKLIREGHGVNQAIELAHRNIKDYAESDALGTNMGTTIVLLLSQGSLYNIFWVGDSRAYLLDKETMAQITVDHSLVQSLIEQGELTKEEAETDPRKNAVTRALGVQELETVRADSISERWQPGQKILLCSDGLTDCVTDANIERIMRSSKNDQKIVDDLIDAALEGGGKDNITIVVVSAPDTVKNADMDTHVPGARSDDTQVPSNDDTLHPDTENSQQKHVENGHVQDSEAQDAHEAITEEQQQLPLALSVDSEADLLSTSNPAPTQIPHSFPRSLNAPPAAPAIKSEERKRSRWLNIGGAIAASLLLFLVFTSTHRDKETPGDTLSNRFIGEDLQPVNPISRNLPDLQIDTDNTAVQVGLFRNLVGAESRQGELTTLGLSPDIMKKTSDGNVRYAVIISPTDESDYQQTLATLQANNLNYFHTRHGS